MSTGTHNDEQLLNAPPKGSIITAARRAVKVLRNADESPEMQLVIVDLCLALGESPESYGGID